MGKTTALEGIKVLDFSWSMAGPVVGKVMASFGASVIKVESRAAPDMMRFSYPFREGISGIDRSGLFAVLNPGKYSMALKMTHPRAKEISRRLASWADVVVENFGVGVMRKFGLDYDELRKIKKDIIMLSIGSYGQTGPYCERVGWGYNLLATAGLSELTGWPDRPGVGPATAYTDMLAPYFGLVAIMAALDFRRRAGTGQYIDLSQFEAGVTFIRAALMDYIVNERELRRMGNRSTKAAPHGIYRCAGDDAWCAISAQTEEEWKAFCQTVGSDLVKAERFSTLSGRLANADDLDRIAEAWTIKRTPQEVMRLMQSHGVPAGIVQSTRDVLDADPQLDFRRFFQKVESPAFGTTRTMRAPAVLTKTPTTLKQPPGMGEHTQYVCKEILNMTDQEYLEYEKAGVFY